MQAQRLAKKSEKQFYKFNAAAGAHNHINVTAKTY